jgi:hypothetical protein
VGRTAALIKLRKKDKAAGLIGLGSSAVSIRKPRWHLLDLTILYPAAKEVGCDEEGAWLTYA